MRRALVLIAAVAILLGGVLYWYARTDTPHTEAAARQTTVTIAATSVTADIADTAALRERGLSGRTGLDDAHGMLFVFESDAPHSFWMNDMLFPIDIIWLSASKHVVHIVQNATPESYPASFVPETSARFVLEVPAGWTARHGVTLGAVAVWQ